MQGNFFVYGLVGALAIALLVAAFTDIRRRQIDNWLNAAIALSAPVYWWAAGLSLWPDIAIQLGLTLGVFIALAGLFAFKMMGGGDVKLLSALALWPARCQDPIRSGNCRRRPDYPGPDARGRLALRYGRMN
ncbi:MAG: prepilin peptidase [Novosphingobium sp.]